MEDHQCFLVLVGRACVQLRRVVHPKFLDILDVYEGIEFCVLITRHVQSFALEFSLTGASVIGTQPGSSHLDHERSFDVFPRVQFESPIQCIIFGFPCQRFASSGPSLVSLGLFRATFVVVVVGLAQDDFSIPFYASPGSSSSGVRHEAVQIFHFSFLPFASFFHVSLGSAVLSCARGTRTSCFQPSRTVDAFFQADWTAGSFHVVLDAHGAGWTEQRRTRSQRTEKRIRGATRTVRRHRTRHTTMGADAPRSFGKFQSKTEQMHPKRADAPPSHDPGTVLGTDPELRLTSRLIWGWVRRRARSSESETRLTWSSLGVSTGAFRVAFEASQGDDTRGPRRVHRLARKEKKPTRKRGEVVACARGTWILDEPCPSVLHMPLRMPSTLC